jgi:hypothetical protein
MEDKSERFVASNSEEAAGSRQAALEKELNRWAAETASKQQLEGMKKVRCRCRGRGWKRSKSGRGRYGFVVDGSKCETKKRDARQSSGRWQRRIVTFRNPRWNKAGELVVNGGASVGTRVPTSLFLSLSASF